MKASSSFIQSWLRGTCVVGETRGLLSFPEFIKGSSPLTLLPPPGPYTPGEGPQNEGVTRGRQVGSKGDGAEGWQGQGPRGQGAYSSTSGGWGLLDPHGCSLGGLGQAAVHEDPGTFSWSPCSVWPLKSSGACESLDPLRAGLKGRPPNSGQKLSPSRGLKASHEPSLSPYCSHTGPFTISATCEACLCLGAFARMLPLPVVPCP